MRWRVLVIIIAAVILLFGAWDAFAQTTDACTAVQDCVDNALEEAVDTCEASQLSCVITNDDKLAVSAGDLARRAIARKGCLTRTFRRRGPCNACFETAKVPLRSKYDVQLFHGVLANAVAIIQRQKVETCSGLTR